jgi:hypothetical protein
MEMSLSGGKSGHDWDNLFIVVEGGLLWWCGFNASVSVREGKRRDEALPKDEAEAVSLSWFNVKEVWHGAVAWWRWLEERWHRGGKREETMPVGLMRILLSQKVKKIHVVDLVASNDSEDLNQRWVNIIFLKHMQVRSTFVHLIA